MIIEQKEPMIFTCKLKRDMKCGYYYCDMCNDKIPSNVIIYGYSGINTNEIYDICKKCHNLTLRITEVICDIFNKNIIVRISK